MREIRERDLTQGRAADPLGITQPDASDLILIDNRWDHERLSLWGEPFERVLFEGWAPGRNLDRHIHLGIHELASVGMRLLPEYRNPREVEAHFLAGTWEYRPGH